MTASVWQSPNVAPNTRDGNVDTRCSTKGDGQWNKYDLDANQMIVNQVSIAWFKGGQRKAAFTIEVSTNELIAGKPQNVILSRAKNLISLPQFERDPSLRSGWKERNTRYEFNRKD